MYGEHRANTCRRRRPLISTLFDIRLCRRRQKTKIFMARHKGQKWAVVMVGHRSSTAPLSGKHRRAVLRPCFLESIVVKYDHEFRKASSKKRSRYNLGKRRRILILFYATLRESVVVTSCSVFATIRESVVISSFTFCAAIWIVPVLRPRFPESIVEQYYDHAFRKASS